MLTILAILGAAAAAAVFATLAVLSEWQPAKASPPLPSPLLRRR